MPKFAMPHVIVLLPGITGSVLKKDGRVIWGYSPSSLGSALLSGGDKIRKALKLPEDPSDVDDLGDGIVADSLASDLHLLPGLWKIDGYGKVAEAIKSRFDVVEGENFFGFPYDWRRDNRVAARKLARQSHEWLKRWRETKNPDGKLILIAHSMGGLVSRYFLEVLEGWKDTRSLITFGTPYRGSLNGLDSLANGLRKGPFGLVDLSDLARELTSIYQLLPIYKCYDGGDGKLVRVGETNGIPNVDAAKAKAALAFHREIEAAVNTHREKSDYQQNGYRIRPIVGIGQDTNLSAKLSGNGVEMLTTLEGRNLRGDGTVPRVSATPIELSDEGSEMFAATQHGSLQNADAVLMNLEGILRDVTIDLSTFRNLKGTVALDTADLFWALEPIQIRAKPSQQTTLTAKVWQSTDKTLIATVPMRAGNDGWLVAELAPLPAGAYRVEVSGDEMEPVADSFAVADVDENQRPISEGGTR